MKKIAILLLLLLSKSAYAELLNEVPADFCDPSAYACSSHSKQTTADYFSGHAPSMKSDEVLFVGSCYILGEGYNPEQEQFAYVYLRKNNSKIDFYAAFSFFYETNPYENMTLLDARERNTNPAEEQILDLNNHWVANLDRDPPWQHFIRESDNGNFSMIGFWAAKISVTCQLRQK